MALHLKHGWFNPEAILHPYDSKKKFKRDNLTLQLALKEKHACRNDLCIHDRVFMLSSSQ